MKHTCLEYRGTVEIKLCDYYELITYCKYKNIVFHKKYAYYIYNTMK